jgi:WhiB family redox-sensing transcriptional regulator
MARPGTSGAAARGVVMTDTSERTDWRRRAACRHTDLTVFFPVGAAGPVLPAVNRAKEICGDCPVRARCLDWALDHDAAYGIWGGRTQDERRALR